MIMTKKILLQTAVMALFTVCIYGQNGKKAFRAGNEFMKNIKYEDALVQYTAALGAEPSNADYYYARGKA